MLRKYTLSAGWSSRHGGPGRTVHELGAYSPLPAILPTLHVTWKLVSYGLGGCSHARGISRILPLLSFESRSVSGNEPSGEVATGETKELKDGILTGVRP